MSKRSWVRESLDSAVGDILMEDQYVNYAFTITPSPYKKVLGGKITRMMPYHTFDEDEQKKIIETIVYGCALCEVLEIRYEKTQRGDIHAHGIINTIVPAYFIKYIVEQFGYSGKSNLDAHYCLLKHVFNYKGWMKYVTKEEHKWNWDSIFKYIKDNDIDI